VGNNNKRVSDFWGKKNTWVREEEEKERRVGRKREIDRKKRERKKKEKRAGRRDQTEQTDRAQLCVPGSRTSRLLLNGWEPANQGERKRGKANRIPHGCF